MKLIIIGDPKGTHSMSALKKYAPEDIFVWENDSRHTYTIKQINDKINITNDLREIADQNMDFSMLTGNPPYQAPNLTGKKGKGGDNSLYIKFIENGVKLLKDGGVMSLITPPSALIKSTILNQPTPTLKLLMSNGSLDELDLTVGKYFSVGTSISKWIWVKGKKQGKVKVTTNDSVYLMDIQDLYYLPPTFTELELKLYHKIISNKAGDKLIVVRGKKDQDCTMERFGYPKVQIGGSGVLGFDKKFYNFMISNTGLWLLDFMRRHDQMLYHNAISGIHIPENGFDLTAEEKDYLDNNMWVNFSRKEHEKQTQ